MFKVRWNTGTLLFTVVVVLVLLGSVPLSNWEWLTQVPRDWVVNVFGLAGMRGLLLGVALGVVITALRVILLGDWPPER
jgi:hypothetical protein